jgi:hypothetical protein
MKITLESTEQIVEVNGVPARVWSGKTERGIEIQALITRVAVRKEADCTQFEQELQEQPAPTVAHQAFPLRMIL